MEASMKQQTLAGFEKYAKMTRRAQFLAEMDRIVPWPELEAVVEPVYPKVSEAGGRPPIPLERMLRIYFLQLWFNLSDPAVEEALYDSESMRRFAGIDLGQESAPDETTVCKFRHLLERNKLGKKLLSTVNEYLARNGIKISKGTIVDATIIGAPSSTKNKQGERDPEMHQTAKGKQWYFGMKAHVAVDSRQKLIHTVLASAANVADSLALPLCCAGRRPACGAIRPIKATRPRSARSRRGLATARTGVIALVAGSTRRSRPRTAISPGCAPRSSMRSG
jgi:IS5 family transposase